MTYQFLILPGWQGSGEDHWQTQWEQLHGYQRVEQHDWLTPLRGDWMMQLEEAVLQAPYPVVLVAHSLGCWLTAAWASHSQNVAKVKAAFLVAPPDPKLFHVEPNLHSWRSCGLQALPFKNCVIYSTNDAYCTPTVSQEMVHVWGGKGISMGHAGHINADSALGNWEQGQQWLHQLINKEE